MLECPECGEPREKCSDPKIVWHMRRSVCHKTIARAAAEWIYQSDHKDGEWHDGAFSRWSKEQSDDTPNHFKDGVKIWVSTEPEPDPPPPSR